MEGVVVDDDDADAIRRLVVPPPRVVDMILPWKISLLVKLLTFAFPFRIKRDDDSGDTTRGEGAEKEKRRRNECLDKICREWTL